MKNILSILLLLCGLSAFGQIKTTISKDCYLLYEHNGRGFSKNKKVKAGTSITLLEESSLYPNLYVVKYKDFLYHTNGNNINKFDLQSYVAAKEDSLLREKQKKDSIKRYNDSVRIAVQKKINDSIAIVKYREDRITKHREDSIKNIKRAFAIGAFNEIEKRKKERVKQGMPIEIVYLVTDKPNSTSGTNLDFEFKNISTKRIKYISVTGYPINAVDDKCVCTIRGHSQCTRRGIGPIEPDKYARYTWENTWYNHTINNYIPTSILIQYMDGTSLTVSGSKLKSIMQNVLLDDVFEKVLKEHDIDLEKL